jgi:hypothetical protein
VSGQHRVDAAHFVVESQVAEQDRFCEKFLNSQDAFEMTWTESARYPEKVPG